MSTGEQLSRDELFERLRRVKDPELQLGIVELGLVYDARFDDGVVDVLMTLTSPACPVGPLLIETVKDVLLAAPEVNEVLVDLTFSPPWNPRTMASEELQMQLGIW
jgi:metal-sulfur cluster biosynthetic enzyme